MQSTHFSSHLIVVSAVDDQTLAMPDLLPEPGLGLTVGDAGHEAGGEALGRGDAPQPVILADRLLLQTLELHALVTSEETQQTKPGKRSRQYLKVMTALRVVLLCSIQPLGMIPSLLGPGKPQFISCKVKSFKRLDPDLVTWHSGSSPLQVWSAPHTRVPFPTSMKPWLHL